MNWSAGLVSEVPPSVVTVTFTVAPGVPAGELPEHEVAAVQLKPGAAVTPNWTEIGGTRPVPVMVTGVPPVKSPPVGLMPVTVGAGIKSGELVKRGVGSEVPEGVVTITSKGPARPAGEVTEHCVAVQLPMVAGLAPNVTEVAPVRPVPFTDTEVPPVVGPVPGTTLVTVGTGPADATS